MSILPSRLAEILRLYGHVEFADPERLGQRIQEGLIADSEIIKMQFEKVIALRELPVQEINKITGEEFEKDDEARKWLRDFYEIVFNKKQ